MSQTAEIIQFPGPPEQSEQPEQQEQPRVVADVDNGYTRLANELVLQLCKTDLSKRESKVLYAVYHKTFGFNKAKDWICLDQFKELTGIAKNHISETVNGLIARRILFKDGRQLGINKVVSEWGNPEKSQKRDTSKNPGSGTEKSLKREQEVPEAGAQSPESGNHKRQDTPTKDNITKDTSEANAIAGRVIDHLVASTGKRFRHTAGNFKFIRARLKEGHTEADLIAVINTKTAHWLKDPRMNEFLRPSTLFNSEKFEGYLNASAAVTNSFAQTDYTQGAEGFDNV